MIIPVVVPLLALWAMPTPQVMFMSPLKCHYLPMDNAYPAGDVHVIDGVSWLELRSIGRWTIVSAYRRPLSNASAVGRPFPAPPRDVGFLRVVTYRSFRGKSD